MKYIKERYNKIADKVVRKLGFEHPATISFLSSIEKMINSAEKNETLRNALTENYFNEYEKAVDGWLRRVK